MDKIPKVELDEIRLCGRNSTVGRQELLMNLSAVCSNNCLGHLFFLLTVDDSAIKSSNKWPQKMQQTLSEVLILSLNSLTIGRFMFILRNSSSLYPNAVLRGPWFQQSASGCTMTFWWETVHFVLFHANSSELFTKILHSIIQFIDLLNRPLFFFASLVISPAVGILQLPYFSVTYDKICIWVCQARTVL